MDDGDDMDASLDGATSKRACDSCRTRKIRCDRLAPCSNCKASKLACMTTAPTQKAQRQRVHISEQYEKKIDRIEDRLAGIENVLASLAAKLSDLDIRGDSAEHSSQSRSSRRGIGRSPGTLDEGSTPAPFEGETTINSQSDYARELLVKAVGSTPSIEQNAEIKSALLALDELVTRQNQATVPTPNSLHSVINHSLTDIDPETLSKPPWDVISEMVKRVYERPSMALAIIFPFLKIKNLYTVIEETYHHPKQYGATRRILVYCILNLLFEEYIESPLPGLKPTEYRTYAVQCKFQIEVALSQLDMFTPATFENIMGLMLGAAFSVELCKPTLTSIIVTKAAGLCQDLGYHRYQTMKDDPEEERNVKIHMFWMIYMFDKTISLQLGRASFIQDFDISLPFFSDEPVSGDVPNGKRMLNYWVKVGRVQGQTYQRLFSPAAFLESPESRTRTAVELVNALNQAWFERGDADLKPNQTPGMPGQQPAEKPCSPGETEPPSRRKRDPKQSLEDTEYLLDARSRVEDAFFYSNVVMHYSTCSLIQRAVSPDNVTFNKECLASAREALAAHMKCDAQFNHHGNEGMWNGYVHWSILLAPFTPFVVLLSSMIQTTDSTDLPSLQRFVTSLESCRTLSEGANKLYKMCHLFLQVAKLYLQAKMQDSTTQPQTFPPSRPEYNPAIESGQFDINSITEFDPYLSALGLLPNSSWPVTNYATPPSFDGLDAFTQGQGSSNEPVMDISGMGLPGGGQNFVQDWFSGSRNLMNMLDAGDDSQMPDINL